VVRRCRGARLDDDEAVAIAVGPRAAASTSVAGIEDTALRAMAKIEQVLPDRLRRRVKAVHGNVSELRWGGDGPTVDAEALAVLAQACRDHEHASTTNGATARTRDASSSPTSSCRRAGAGIWPHGMCVGTTGARSAWTGSAIRSSPACGSRPAPARG